MIKRVFAAIISLSLVMCLAGCRYKGYSGENVDLFTAAINSVLWNNGHSYSTDWYKNPDIEVVERDKYGRTLFRYYEKYYAGGGISFSSLIVCQHADDEYAYYYEDVNFIIVEEDKTNSAMGKFDDEKVNQLKAANDWNREIQLEKCVKKKLTRKKPDIPYGKEMIENKIVDAFKLKKNDYRILMDILTRDPKNDSFIMYGYILYGESENILFVGLVTATHEMVTDVKFLVPSNLYEYQSELTEFKKANGWNYL